MPGGTIVVMPKAAPPAVVTNVSGTPFELRADQSPWLTTQATFKSGHQIELAEDAATSTITINSTAPASTVNTVNGANGDVKIDAGTGLTKQETTDGVLLSADYGNVVRNVTVNGQILSGALTLAAGPGIALTTLPNSTIRIDNTFSSGVQMVNGYTGQISIAAGAGISIANTPTSTGGQITIAASGLSSGVRTVNTLGGDVKVRAGSGIQVSTDPGTNSIIISAVTGGASPGGWGGADVVPHTSPFCQYLVSDSSRQTAYLVSAGHHQPDYLQEPENANRLLQLFEQVYNGANAQSSMNGGNNLPYAWLLPGRTYTLQFFTKYPMGNSGYGDIVIRTQFFSVQQDFSSAAEYDTLALLGQAPEATFPQNNSAKASNAVTFTTPNTYPRLCLAYFSVKSGLSPTLSETGYCALLTLLN
jgi:hypothetical protein